MNSTGSTWAFTVIAKKSFGVVGHFYHSHLLYTNSDSTELAISKVRQIDAK